MLKYCGFYAWFWLMTATILCDLFKLFGRTFPDSYVARVFTLGKTK